MSNLVMTSAIAYNDLTTYDVKGDLNGSVEVQFDDGEFNGKILYSAEGQEFGEEEWVDITDKELYEYIKERAIKDYKGIK